MSGSMAMADAPRLAVIADSPATGSLVREALATLLPGIPARTLDPGATSLDLDQTDCVVVDASVGGAPGISLLRRVRAAGYAGAAVLLLEPSSDARLASDAASLGAHIVDRTALGTSLAAAVAEALAARSDEAAAAPVRDALQRAQRLLAAGEIALRMQHSLNNPLAALLAESQLLAMEQMQPDHHEAVKRIVDQLRRVISIVKQLDGIAKPKQGEG